MPAWISRRAIDAGRSGGALKRLLPTAVLLLGIVPLVKLGWDGLGGRLGANPIAEALNRLGFWALTFLTASLAPTPLKTAFGITWPMRIRRMLGLFAFTYAALHFATYLGVDQFFDLTEIGKDLVKRKFITVGFITFLLLVPLAVTSTNGWVRRLGFPRWKRLHRLVYLAALLGVFHFIWRVKADLRLPSVFAAVVLLLLGARLVPWTWREWRSARARAASQAQQ